MSLQSKFMNVTNPMLQVFSSQEIDNSIIDYEFIQKYNQDGSDIQNVEKPLYEFVVTDRDSWMNLSESFIEARVSIVRNDTGAAITAGNIALVNNGFNLFKRAEYQYDGKGVLETIDYPGHKNQILGLINNSQDAEKSLTNEFWYPDRAGDVPQQLYIREQAVGDRMFPITISTGGSADQFTFTVPTPAGANDDAVITLRYGSNATVANTSLIRVFTQTGVTALQLDQRGADNVANGPRIDHAGLAAGDTYRLYDDNNNEIELYAGGYKVSLTASNNALSIVYNFAVGGPANLNGASVYAVKKSTNLLADSGFVTRKNKFVNAVGTYDKVATIYLPLRKLFGFFDYNRVVLKGATHKLSLYRNDIGRSLFRDATAVNGKIKFWGLSWWIPYCVPKPELDMALNEKLLKGAEVALGFYDYKYYEYPTTLASGSTSQIQWTVQSDITKPVKVFLWFQNVDANSEQTINSMKFDKAFVQTARCIINSNVHYPKEEYQLDFTDAATTQNISRAYLEFLRAGGKAFSTGSGPSISLEEYKELYPILVFDLSKQDSKKVYEYVGTNTIQIKLTFGTGHPQNLKLYAYVQNERVATLRGVQNKIDVLTS